MKRRSCVFILIMVFALSFLMVACDKDDNKNNSSSSKDSYSSSSQLESSTSIFDTAITIYVGDKVTANISQAGQQVCFKFVPTETKTYNFKSLGDFDTCCYLYDKNQKLIKSNDNGTNYNFSLDCNLTKGQTYYFVVELFDKNQTENFKVELNIASQQDSSKDSSIETNSGSNNDQPSNSQPGSTVGEYMYFGSYPQTRITNSSLISTLNNLAGTKPTAQNSNGWTVYAGYYISNAVSNYMWYIDKEYGGEKYRGVYFNQYRPFWVADSSALDRSYQDDYGYSTNVVYWFKFEPLKWRVLSKTATTALLFSENIIDSQQYDYDGTYSSVYVNSTIRSWLNNNFYQTAFSATDKQNIVKTTCVHDARSTNAYEDANSWNNGVNNYVSSPTQENVFLLSKYELTNPNYGFGAHGSADAKRQKLKTDYAKVQGASMVNINETYGYYWTRSSRANNSQAHVIYSNGYAGEACHVYNTSFGVAPAITVKI